MKSSSLISVGLRAKSGRAIAVVLRGPVEAPAVVHREEIVFCGPDERQPYHAVMELPWNEAQAAVMDVAVAIKAAATEALRRLLAGAQGVGIVGAAPRQLERIGNFHIRAHAAEGVFFREVLEAAAEANGLRHWLFAEKGLAAAVAPALGIAVPELNGRLAELGRAVGSPWRADEKAAALAGWAVLAKLP
jgi:hypothetical protein